MADQPISKLPAHTVPTGSDELAIVSGGVTKKITQQNLLSNSLFYSTASPTIINVEEIKNQASPVLPSGAGTFPAQKSGSAVAINDQYTKIIFDAGTGSYAAGTGFSNDIVLYVGDNLPGNTGMCIIEFESTGSNRDGNFHLWYDGGGRGGTSTHRVSDNTNGYQSLLFDDNDGDGYGALDAKYLMTGGEYTGSFQTTMMYTKIGNNPSGSFYQLGGTNFLYS